MGLATDPLEPAGPLNRQAFVPEAAHVAAVHASNAAAPGPASHAVLVAALKRAASNPQLQPTVTSPRVAPAALAKAISGASSGNDY